MDTEKKAKAIIVGVFIAVIFAGVIAYLSTVPKEAIADTGKESTPAERHEVTDSYTFPVEHWKNEGYDSFPKWWKDVMSIRAERAENVDDLINEYSDYLTDSQISELKDLKKSLKNSTNLTKIEENQNKVDDIINEAKGKQEEEQAALNEVNNTAVYSDDSSYSSANSADNSSYNQQSSYDGNGFKSQGVVNWNNTRYTWYSSNELYHYQTGEWSVDSNGFYVNDDGYYIVASSDYQKGTIVDTPFGHQGIVMDSGCASGTLDMYTKF